MRLIRPIGCAIEAGSGAFGGCLSALSASLVLFTGLAY